MWLGRGALMVRALPAQIRYAIYENIFNSANILAAYFNHIIFNEVNMKQLIAIALSTSIVLTSGCATILSGDTQMINVTTSNNKTATFTMDGQNFQVPAVINVPRQNKDLIVTTTGDCQGQALAAKSINPVFFVNVFSGGIFGSTTDYSTESMWQYQSNLEIKCS